MYIDCRGKACPQPVVLSLKALKELSAGESLEVQVDNTTAVENLKRMSAEKGCDIAVKDNGDGTWTLTVTPKDADTFASIDAEQEGAAYCAAPTAGPTVIAVGTDEMGQGDPELGHILIKGYLYAVRQMDDLPKTILFFNGGAKLTVEGSASLEDLQDLAARGVQILTCGTCLDFYGIKDKLAVGEVTNMYVIADTMRAAGKVIRI